MVASSLGVVASKSVTSTVPASTEAAIRDSAQQFEALLIQQMLREIRQSSMTEPMSDTSMSYREIADDQMATQMAQAGGFGFGKAMADQLLAQIKARGLSGTAQTTVNTTTN